MEYTDPEITLPYEIIYQIALDLPLKSLTPLCRTASIFSNICNDEVFLEKSFDKIFSKSVRIS